jgi:hypothetical protein
MLLCEFNSVNEIFDRFQTGKYDILSFEGIFSEKYFKASNLLMSFLDEIGVRACELIKIIAKQIN